MKKDDNSDNRKFSIKDIITIALCIIALIVLILILRYTRNEEKQKQEELNSINNEIESGVYNNVVDTFGTIVINEVNQEGWVELYNSGKSDVDLSGIELTVNGEVVLTVPDGTIINKNDRYVLDSNYNAGLKKNDIIGLYDTDGNEIYHILLPALKQGESYASRTDGSVQKAVMSATKGNANEEGTPAKGDGIVFSVPGGFYSAQFSLEISAPDGYTIYYTVDGTKPDENSTVYTKPIEIANRSGANFVYADSSVTGYYSPSTLNMGTVVRAIAVKDGKRLPEEIQSYYIELGQASDYIGIPVLSITIEPNSLFDYFDGMYVTGRSYEDNIASGGDGTMAGNYYNDWEKEAYIEFFEADKGKSYEGKINLKMLVDYSITGAQKSFLAIDAAEAAKGSALSNFITSESPKLTIETNKSDNSYKIREYILSQLLDTTSTDMAYISPCIVFIDGEYWGCYMLRSSYDRTYINEKYNVKEDVIFVTDAKVNDWRYQDLFDKFIEFVICNDMSDEDNYRQLNEMMDVQSYLDYLCINMYLANPQYGSETSCIWRTVTSDKGGYEDGRWRWLLGKMDNSMANGTTGRLSTASIDSFLMKSVTQDPFLQSLLMNKSFCSQLKDTMTRMAKEVFDTERTETALHNSVDMMQKAALSSYKRFYGNVSDNFYSSEVNKISAFFNERAEYILLYTEELVSQGGNTEVINAARDEFLNQQEADETGVDEQETESQSLQQE